jgi:hypothetical protein
MKHLAWILLVVMTAMAAGQKLTTDQEIDILLRELGASGCKFQRNGSWYQADKAVEHLQKKRNYLVKKGKIKTAEDFIALGASESSMSGKPYRVACPDVPEVDSKTWLQGRLENIRSRAYRQ